MKRCTAVKAEARFEAPAMPTKPRLLIITNLFADPFGPTRATFNQQQFSRLREHMDVQLIVPVSFVPVIKNPLGYWRLKKQTQAKWPYADYVVYWYIPGVMRGLHGTFLLMSLLLQRLPTLLMGRWDVILGSWGYPDAWVATVLGKLKRTPVVVQVLGSDINVFTQDRMRRAQIRWLLDQAQAVVSVSKALVGRMTGLGVRGDHMHVLYNGVDGERFHPLDMQASRLKHGVKPDEEMILFVGNILVTKGCGELLEAFARLAAKRPRLSLVFVGDGPMRKALEARVKELGLSERVRFPGRVAHEQLKSWFACASVFCLPSYSEGVPNVVLEAMACGKAVVSTDVGGVAEVLPDFAGTIIQPQDDVALEQALGDTLDATWDHARIAAYTAQFNWAVNVAQFRDILLSARDAYRR
jgi:glycosyltransferase involved in cell wall biosynthesis